jgi:CRISPR/Cas system-associated protein Cas5 (RAMP superfamily)
MKANKSDDLVKKYLEAKTSLSEEKKLFVSSELNKDLMAWSQFVKHSKKKPASDLKDSIMDTINMKQRKKQRYLMQFSGIAASLVLIALFLYNQNTKQNEDIEKELLLEEALSMFDHEDQKTERKDIVYEDDMVIIYIVSK